MNYSKFCQHEAPLHMLTKKEIEHPYLVLDDLCKKRTKENFQKELGCILSKFYKHAGWKDHDPGSMYELCEDLVRLIDVLYLIYRYSPALSSKKHVEAVSNTGKKMAAFNRIFTNRAEEEAVCSDEGRTVLNYFYNACHIGFLKLDLNCTLQVVLDASYMSNDKYEYFGLEQSDFLINLHRLYDLIAEGYSIYMRGKSAFPVLEACPELAFARDKNHPTYLLAECIAKPTDVIRHFYSYYIEINHLHDSLKAWKKMLFIVDFWKEEENPGNLIHLHHCIATLIDVCWLSDKKSQLETMSSGLFNNSKRSKAMIKKCSKEEQESPLLVIRNFFAFKRMCEWKLLLDEWLSVSLSNSKAYDKERKSEVNKDFKYLIKFMEAVYLISSAPSIEETT